MSWQTIKLGDVCEIVSGATPKTGKQDYWGGDIFWATPTDLSGLNKKLIIKTERKITEAGLSSCAAKILPRNSVLFSSRAPIGLVAINDVPMATNQGFKSFIPNANLLSPDYLYWWLRKSRAYLNELGVGATFKEVSKSIVERIEIPLPPLAEQKRIAAILDKAAEIKAKREQAIAKLDELAMSTFMKMFGNQPDSVETTLGECLRLINGRAYLQHELLNEGTPIIRIQNLNGGNRWYYSNLKLPEEKYCDNGDLLFAWSATFGPYIWRGNKSIYHYHIWKIEPKELFDKTFAFYLLQSITREIKNASHGASMLHMTKSGMEAWPIKLPPLKAQMRFVEFANRLQSIREAMEESKGIIFDKEKSLQHQAFTVGFNA